MASYLGDLALGLRQAAGVLNPDVQKETFAADQRTQQTVDQLRANMLLRQQQAQIEAATPQADLARQQVELTKQKVRKEQILEKAFQDGGEQGYMQALRAIDPQTYIKLETERRKNALDQQATQAQQLLAQHLSTGGYQGNADNPNVGPADSVAPNDQAAIAQLQQAEAQGRPMSVNVPSPQTTQALSVLADPKAAIPALLRQQAGPVAMTPYQQENLRLQQERLNQVLKPVRGPDGTVTYQPASSAAGQQVGSPGMGAVAPGITPENAHLNGPAFLDTLAPDVKNKVQAVINYDAPLTTFGARNNGERSAVLAMAKQADPNFSAMKYPVRQQVMQDFTKGPTANNIVALDQAINHMGTMYDLMGALKNNDIQVVNQAVNFLRNQTGDPKVNNAATAQQAVGEELMRVFRQVNASEREAADWQRKFSTAQSPAQIKGAVQTAVTLLEGRVNAINNRWNRAFETDTGYPKLFSPEALGVFKKLDLKMKVPQVQGGSSSAGSADIDALINKYRTK